MGTLYENIKTACDEKGISVSKLCVDLGYSKSNMTNLKKGQATMNSERLARFASYLGVTVDELISQKAKIDPAENEVDLQDEFEKLKKKIESSTILFKGKKLESDKVSAVIASINVIENMLNAK